MMDMKTEDTKAEETRALILQAAMTRILHYGYGKTTMAEIARDCDMSAGNIYRFFASKLDIAEALAWKKHGLLMTELERIAGDTSRSAPERMRALLWRQMQYWFDLVAKDDKVLEIAEVLERERPDFVRQESRLQRRHFVRILEDGMVSGEFAPIDDTEMMADTIQTATMKFCYPTLLAKVPRERLEDEMRRVSDLLIRGLVNR
jgi:AcrR family transcriptional regulator